MKLQDTTDPRAHRGCRTLFSETAQQQKSELAERFRVHLIGVYYSEVGPSWSSEGRLEGDFVHHVDLVCSGRRQVVHEGRVTELAPGYAWYLPACTPVERRCQEWCRLYFVKFRCEWLPGVDPLLDWPGRHPVRLGEWQEGMFPELSHAGPGMDSRSLVVLQGQIQLWLGRALGDFERIMETHLQSHRRFEKVFELLDTKLGADLRVGDMAAAAKMGRMGFSMAFRRNVGLSPKDWLGRRLNQEAIRLLIQTDARTKEIAQQLRFSDEYHFSRFFKRLNGVAPTPYRQRFFRRP